MRKMVGAMGIILGTLVLSLEIYGLRLIQSIEMAHGEWWDSAWSYAGEAPCTIALVLTAIVIIVSLTIFLSERKK